MDLAPYRVLLMEALAPLLVTKFNRLIAPGAPRIFGDRCIAAVLGCGCPGGNRIPQQVGRCIEPLADPGSPVVVRHSRRSLLRQRSADLPGRRPAVDFSRGNEMAGAERLPKVFV